MNRFEKLEESEPGSFSGVYLKCCHRGSTRIDNIGGPMNYND